MRRVPDIASVEIASLRKAGITVSDDDVVWLSCLAHAVENPTAKTRETAGFERLVRMSDGTVLAPLTVAASRWLEQYGCIFADVMDLFSVAYAMVRTHDFSLSQSARQVVDSVTEWAGALRVSPNELAIAVDRLLSSDEPIPIEKPKPVDLDRVIAKLAAGTGQPAEYWQAKTWAEIETAHGGLYDHASMIAEYKDSPEAAESKAALKRLAAALREVRDRGEVTP
jgi:hypothetical protein